jgi:hypothetical protein
MLRKIQTELIKKGVLIGKYPSCRFQSFEITGFIFESFFANSKEITIAQIGANDGLSGEDPLHNIITKYAGGFKLLTQKLVLR